MKSALSSGSYTLTNHIMRLSFTIIMTISMYSVLAQEIVVEDRYDEYFGYTPAGYLALRNQVNLQDYTLGLEFGFINKDRNLTFFGNFDARPYRKSVIRYQGNNLFYQFREERYFIGAGAEYYKGFRDSNLGGFIQINPQFTWGAYGGTERKPEKGWVITPRVGVSWNLNDNGFLKVGYAYLDTRNQQLDKHRLTITVARLLKKDR